MFNRPRCRDWTPLATQQLRLRNLIKITGQNIICKAKCQLYFTLHSTPMSAPFYTSEKMDLHGSNTVDWPEISCQMIMKSTSTFVCIRVWEHIPSQEVTTRNICDDILRSRRKSTSPSSNDKMLFIWGVYFSGLIYITKRSEARFQENSLSFQMHGGHFASPDSLTQETMRQQLAMNYKLDQRVTSSPTSSLQNLSVSSDGALKTATKSCDIFSNLSPSDVGSSKNSTKTTANSEFQINSPRTSRSCSPVRDDRTNCLHFDICKDLLEMLKIRYVEKRFLNSEIRPSYTLEKLLKLQELQRKCRQKSEHSKEIMEKICMKSAFCLNLELISNKGFILRPRGNPSMGRTLNRLLFQETQVKPEDILKAQDLKRQIETAKFRCRLLTNERDKKKSNIDQLGKKLSQMHDDNVEGGSWLMSRYRNLGREIEMLTKQKVAIAGRQEFLTSVQKSLKDRRSQLCRELQEIYPIRKRSNGQFAIHNMVLPNAENLRTDDKLLGVEYVWEPVSPLSLSVALGYVAHIVQMCSVILNLPLRNPIKHEGSRSRIMDVIKEIPITSREFPLYSRTNPPPKVVLYAVYLLNQNLAQLNYQLFGIKCDLRTTLPNLLCLLNGPDVTDNGLVATEQHQIASVSGSSIDLNIPVPHVMSEPVDVIQTKINDERISRSVGSYSDEQLSSNGKNFHSSEPILTIQTVLKNFNENGNI